MSEYGKRIKTIEQWFLDRGYSQMTALEKAIETVQIEMVHFGRNYSTES